MMKNHNLRLVTVLLSVLVVAAAFVSGCNRKTTESLTSANYRVAGGLIIDTNRSVATVIAELQRNDTALSEATIRFAGNALVFVDAYLGLESVYLKQIDPPDGLAGEQAYFGVADGNNLRDSALYSVADTFSLTALTPFNHLLQTIAQNVSLEWTGSARADLYVMAAVKVGEEFTGSGYSTYPNLSGTAGTIPSEAFTHPVSGELENGLYYVYTYAVTGSPDSALTSRSLPVPLPGQLADNIDAGKLQGRFGTVVVSAPDTVRVLVSAR